MKNHRVEINMKTTIAACICALAALALVGLAAVPVSADAVIIGPEHVASLKLIYYFFCA